MKKFVLLVLLLSIVTTIVYAEEGVFVLQGDFNEDVVALNQKLIELGYFNLREESPWGPDNEWALMVLQWNMDWDQTGVVESKEKFDEILSLVNVVGKNLLVDSDYYIEKDNKSDAVESKLFAVEYSDLQELIGKTVTISVYVNSPGERGTSVDDPSNMIRDRFGVHGYLTWSDSTGNLENKNTYPGIDLLSRSVEDSRISNTFTITAPEGYDTLTYVAVAFQSGARPAADNVIWSLGYPKLEIGNKDTGWIK